MYKHSYSKHIQIFEPMFLISRDRICVICSVYVKLCNLPIHFLKRLCHSVCPLAVYESPGCSVSSPELDWIGHLNVNHCKMCEVVSHCGFND